MYCNWHLQLRTAGKRLFFVTNNSTKSRKGYKKKFDELGLDVQAEEVCSYVLVYGADSSESYLSDILFVLTHTHSVTVSLVGWRPCTLSSPRTMEIDHRSCGAHVYTLNRTGMEGKCQVSVRVHVHNAAAQTTRGKSLSTVCAWLYLFVIWCRYSVLLSQQQLTWSKLSSRTLARR